MEQTISLCSLNQLPELGARGFDPFHEGRDTLFVVRQESKLYAYLDLCPHFGDTPLPWRKDAYLNAGGDYIVCSSHGSQFDIATGKCTLGPCLGRSLTPIPVQVSEEGDVQVVLDNSSNSEKGENS